jgi:hypothetical protein
LSRKGKPKRASTLHRWPLLLCLALAACGPYPRDVSGTLDRIEREGRLRVGFADLSARDRVTARRFVARLEAATGARADIDLATMENQLGRLEDGELELVIGEFREDTPWSETVTVIEPLERRVRGVRAIGLSPVTVNGENRWIALVEREVRDSAGKPRR